MTPEEQFDCIAKAICAKLRSADVKVWSENSKLWVSLADQKGYVEIRLAYIDDEGNVYEPPDN